MSNDQIDKLRIEKATQEIPAVDENMFIDDDNAYLKENPTEENVFDGLRRKFADFDAHISPVEFKSRLKELFPEDDRLVGYYLAMFILGIFLSEFADGFNFQVLDTFSLKWAAHLKSVQSAYEEGTPLNSIYLQEFYKIVTPKWDFMNLDFALGRDNSELIRKGSEFANPSTEA